MKKETPQIIQEVGFDFSWDERKVWALDVPIEQMSTDELAWHFTIPFLWSKPDGFYDLKPVDVITNAKKYPEEYQRTLQAELNYPIDVMFYKNRWVILDGLHRLMKAAINRQEMVQVRKVPGSAIPLIARS